MMKYICERMSNKPRKCEGGKRIVAKETPQSKEEICRRDSEKLFFNSARYKMIWRIALADFQDSIALPTSN